MVFLPRSISRTWNFWATYAEKKIWLRRPKSVVGHISSVPQDSFRIKKKLDLLGLKTYQKPIASGLRYRKFGQKTIFYNKTQKRPFWPPLGQMGQKGAARLCFRSKRTSGASFVKIRLCPPTMILGAITLNTYFQILNCGKIFPTREIWNRLK